MKLSLPILAAILVLPSFSTAATLQDYLATRKRYGISQSVSPAALRTFVGQKVVEVRGHVRGFLAIEGKQLLVVEDPDTKREIYIQSTDAPDWLRHSNSIARLIIQAERDDETAPVVATLVAAWMDYQITEIEQTALKKAQEKLAAQQKSAASSRTSPPATSRGGQPPKMPGNLPTISGQIGRTSAPIATADVVGLVPEYTNFIRGYNKKLTQAQAQSIAETVLAYSIHFGVDARLVMALVMCESGFNPDATSHAGAQGLGQLMPGTARGLGVSNSYDTEQNLYGTVKLLRGNLDKYTSQTGDDFEGLVLALAAYNAGGGAVKRHGGVPPYKETQNYVRKVIATYKKLIGQ
ncbi:lytic transglycosylase domain-containing protein [Kamptonema cortianum]|nr:lytic transglycosylase domain-containing protein [Kamptonema cortianum]